MSSSDTWKVTLDISAEARDGAEDALIELGAAVVSKPTDDGRWQLQAIFAGQQQLIDIRNYLTGLIGDGHIDWDRAASAMVADRNWIVESQHFRQPVRAGLYYIHESHSRPGSAPGGKTIEVAASLAFGTGQHGSTEGCLKALNLLQKSQRYRNILDIGSGSGILAIAAAKTWNANILATDIDSNALPVARALARRNGVLRAIGFHIAAGFNHPEIRARAPYDLILANILAEPLINFVADMRRHISAGGAIVLSGLLNRQAQSVTAVYRAHGMVLKRQLIVGNWSTLIVGPRSHAGL